jgi:hypothetical protein
MANAGQFAVNRAAITAAADFSGLHPTFQDCTRLSRTTPDFFRTAARLFRTTPDFSGQPQIFPDDAGTFPDDARLFRLIERGVAVIAGF